MKKFIYFIFLFSLSLLLINLVKGSPEISLSYENEINQSEFNISVHIENIDDGSYDVKLDLTADGERIAKIYNSDEGKWKSTSYYLLSVLKVENNQGEYTARLKTDYNGDAVVNAKIRNEKKVYSASNNITFFIQKENSTKTESILNTNNEAETGKVVYESSNNKWILTAILFVIIIGLVYIILKNESNDDF